MKRFVLSTILVMCLVLAGCNNKSSETTPSSLDSVTSEVTTTVPSYAQTIDIDVGNTGDYKYTFTFNAPDYTTYVFKGSTNQYSILGLLDEMKYLSSEFRFETDGVKLTTIREQAPTNGCYYALYVNGKYVDNLSVLNDNTLISDNYNIKVNCINDNVFYNDLNCKIPSVEDISQITIFDYADQEKVVTYVFTNKNDTITLQYEVHKHSGETMTVDASDSVTLADFQALREIVISLNDVVIAGTTMPEQNSRRYLIYVNNYICLSESQSVTDFLEKLPLPTTT